MTSALKTVAAALLALCASTGIAAADVKISAPCTDAENWTVSTKNPQDPRLQESDEMDRQLGKLAVFFPQDASQGPVRLLSEALFARRIAAKNSELAAAADYALGRALERLGLFHAAHRTYQRAGSAKNPEVSRAALVCLSASLAKHPALKLEKPEMIHGAAVNALLGTTTDAITGNSLGELALRSGLLSNPRKPVFSNRWLDSQPHRSAWSELARGIAKSLNGDSTAAARALESALVATSPVALPEEYINAARLTYARTLSSLGRHVEAERQLHLISKASNFLPAALTEIAWQRLDAGRLREAVGAALSLQAGTLKRVFAPESLLVLSMALNELCRYPEAQQALNLFRKNYSESASYLEKKGFEGLPLENLALQALKKKNSSDSTQQLRIPRLLETELLASPVFQEAQREKKLWREELDAMNGIQERAKKEQNAIAAEIARMSKDIKTRLKGGTPDRAAIRTQLIALRELLRTEKKFRESAPFGKALISKQRKDHATALARLEKQVQQDLVARLEEKKRLLGDVVEQASLVEIEVQQGGGKDIILTHARGEQGAQGAPRERTAGGNAWNWGTRSTASLGEGEVWEDELGGFEADLVSRCVK